MTGAFRPATISAAILALACLVRADGSAAQNAMSIEEEIAGYEQAIRDFGCTEEIRANIDGLSKKIDTEEKEKVLAVEEVYNQRTQKFTDQINLLTIEIESNRSADADWLTEIDRRFSRMWNRHKKWVKDWSASNQTKKTERIYSGYKRKLEGVKGRCW
jgi:hypothetical protein